MFLSVSIVIKGAISSNDAGVTRPSWIPRHSIPVGPVWDKQMCFPQNQRHVRRRGRLKAIKIVKSFYQFPINTILPLGSASIHSPVAPLVMSSSCQCPMLLNGWVDK